MAKVGLYFGSFNPIHIGHLAIAGYMTEFTDLEQVWFVVSPHNPLKKKEVLLAGHYRFDMVQIAISGNDKFEASDIEFRLPIPSYTIDTLTFLEEKYPRHKFCLIMGEDNLYTLHKWKNPKELLKKCSLYVYPRPDVVKPFSPVLEQLIASAEIHFADAPLMNISGTFIRKGVKQGKDMTYFLPPKVWKHITDMHFYEK
jgi:nicotinate-nucleotide adenylyltransferase